MIRAPNHEVSAQCGLAQISAPLYCRVAIDSSRGDNNNLTFLLLLLLLLLRDNGNAADIMDYNAKPIKARHTPL